jgi:1,4-alpha-glucan branching enzyme
VAVRAVIDVAPAGPGTVVVTFQVPACAAIRGVSVVGEFNDWSAVDTPMARSAEGFTAWVWLPVGRTYRFRYLVDDQRWENDWAADSYVANEFGGDDSLIDLTPTGPHARTVGNADHGGRRER